MKQSKLIDVFIDGVKAYFEHLEKDSLGLDIGAPYLVRCEDSFGSDYTGMISVVGSSQGFVFFSAPRSMLKHMLLSYGESDLRDQVLGDLVGEVANTISGNARRKMGGDFHISPPTITRGKIGQEFLKFSSRSYVMPLRWRNNIAQLIICLN